MKKLLPLLLLGVLLRAQPVGVTAHTDSSRYLIGDAIRFTISVTAPAGTAVLQPQIKDSIKQLEILSSSSSQDKSESSSSFTFVYLLAGYDSLDVTIPPLPVYLQKASGGMPDTLFTKAVSFTIRTVAVDTSAAIKDVKEPELIPFDWILLLWVVLAMAAVAVIAYLLYRWYKKRPVALAEPSMVRRTPAEYAILALDELAARRLWQDGRVKEYHSEITGIVRGYFEAEYRFPALETTTSEILSTLRSGGRAQLAELTEGFLTNADMVKFAKFIPMADINEKMLVQAYAIVRYQPPTTNGGGAV